MNHIPATRELLPYRLLTVLFALGVVGCASVQEKVPFVGEKYRIRNEGYSLLYELASKQSDVDKILMVKHAQPKIAALIKEIAQTFVQEKGELELFAQKDSGLSLRSIHLPPLERKTRESIESSTTKTLLFSSGKEFELQLLLTQVQALDYASHLARSLGGQDNNKARKAFLDQFAKQCEQHYKNTISLLLSL